MKRLLGNIPEKLLYDKSINSISSILATEEGMFPWKSLFERFKCLNFGSIRPTSLGSWSLNLFAERSRNCKLCSLGSVKVLMSCSAAIEPEVLCYSLAAKWETLRIAYYWRDRWTAIPSDTGESQGLFPGCSWDCRPLETLVSTTCSILDLDESLKTLNLVNSEIKSNENKPSKLLSCSDKYSMDLKFLMKDGSFPLRWFDDRSRTRSLEKLDKQRGISPTNLFWLRRSSCNCSKLQNPAVIECTQKHQGNIYTISWD